MLLKLRYELDSNPTLSAILLKIKESHEVTNPLSGISFLVGMNDMDFCKPRVRSVKRPIRLFNCTGRHDFSENSASPGAPEIEVQRVESRKSATPSARTAMGPVQHRLVPNI